MPKLNRRAFLRGVGGAAIALPWLEAMSGCGREAGPRASRLRSSQQAMDGVPKRFVVFFSANGTIPGNWVPDGVGGDFSMSPILGPLAAHKAKLNVLSGIDMLSTRSGPGDGHQKGMGHMLTGTELLEGDQFPGGGNSGTAGWGGGISVDQELVKHIGQTTRLGSLELGVQVRSATVWSRMSYLGADQPVPPEENPYAAFERVFGNLGDDPLGRAERVARRRTVLDTVMSDYQNLSARLGASDRQRLDNHLESIREVERRLDANAGVGESCATPTLGEVIDHNANDNYPLVGRLQMDLLAMALACDLTRVASLQWSRSVSNVRFSWLPTPVPEGHHQLSHEGDSNGDAVDKLTRINTWYAEQFAYLLGRLDSMPEGDGTVLDNTLVLWCNELGKGNSHTRNNMPYVLAGGAGGAVRGGRHLAFDGDHPHNNLLVSILNAFDVDTDSFGNPAFCTGPIPGLVG